MTEADRKNEIVLAEYRRKNEIALAEKKNTNEIALAEYKEVVAQFRELTNIRFKLLTYLPLGTVAATVFVPATNDLVKQPAFPAFAFLVTLCIAMYDKRNDQLYDELVSRAAELERELQIEHGSFLHRPTSWLKYSFVTVDHRPAIGLIYAAAAGLWAYLFMNTLDKDQCWLEYLQFRLVRLQPCLIWLQFNLIWLKVVAPAAVIACWLGLRSIEGHRHDRLEEATKDLMDQLIASNAGDSQAEEAERTELVKKIMAEPLLDVDEKKAERRVKYHWKEYQKKRGDPHAASALLGAVIDLPARWIEDVYTGRR